MCRSNAFQIIQNVLKSVATIRELEGLHQHEGEFSVKKSNLLGLCSLQSAIMAYAAALRLAFISSILYFVIVNVLILPIQLPRLGKGKVAADVEEE